MNRLLALALLLSLSACCIPKGDTGAQGPSGLPGLPGQDGAQGPKGDTGNKGNKGDTGSQGSPGVNGTNGTNGSNGTNGTNAPINPFDIDSLINPCGDAPGVYDEIFIKLKNGTVIVSFSANTSGDLTRFVTLPAGTYQTTDGDSCVFSIDSSGNITFENHHF